MSLSPLLERRHKATRWFVTRVVVLLFLIGAIAYAAWFAPWARHIQPTQIEVTR